MARNPFLLHTKYSRYYRLSSWQQGGRSSAYICPHGRKSGYAGYYLHIEPIGDGLLGRSIIASGAHCPLPKFVQSIREEILDNGAGFDQSVKRAEGWRLDDTFALKRIPRGFPVDSKWGDYLRLKDFILEQDLDPVTRGGPQ